MPGAIAPRVRRMFPLEGVFPRPCVEGKPLFFNVVSKKVSLSFPSRSSTAWPCGTAPELECHAPVQARVVNQEHHPHAAAPQREQVAPLLSVLEQLNEQVAAFDIDIYLNSR